MSAPPGKLGQERISSVIGADDDVAVGGQILGEKIRLNAETAVAVGEHDERKRPVVRHGRVSNTVGMSLEKSRRSKLRERRLQRGCEVLRVGRLGLVARGLRCRIPDHRRQRAVVGGIGGGHLGARGVDERPNDETNREDAQRVRQGILEQPAGLSRLRGGR
jgi:hypothetical protein